MLSLKLATSNIKKGFKSFAPFLMAAITMFVMIFVTASIAMSPSIEKIRGGSSLAQLMGFALVVLAIFALLILIYSYRFLQLQRSREFGLYDILGFGKSRIAGVAFLELILSYLITVIVGSLCGIAFAKFLYLVFINMIGGDYFNLAINPAAIGLVALLYLVFFLILMMIGVWIIWRSSSLDLLRESSKGEKEPRSNLFLAALALILLGAGYYIALTVQNPISALLRFFIAVLLVIFGTYLFYVSFTVWYLKRKKKRPSYYKPNNFITISSMLYRMKANAVGLANITILLSMTVVTVVVSLGIFVGTERLVSNQFPREAKVFSFDSERSSEEATKLTQKVAKEQSIKLSNLISFQSQEVEVKRATTTDDSHFVAGNGLSNLFSQSNYMVILTTRASLKALGNENLPPQNADEVLLSDRSTTKTQSISKIKSVQWFDRTYHVKKQLSTIKNVPTEESMSNMLLVFPNEESYKAALQSYNEMIKATQKDQAFEVSSTTRVLFDLQKNDEKKFAAAFKSAVGKDSDLSLYYRSDAMQSQRSQIGSFVFVGFVLGISFILGAALIIYYKQLSEGAQDKRSFKILQEVGLSKVEVQTTIKSQVRMIFFLPLVITVCHFAGAYRMIEKMIMLFGITDRTIILIISLGTMALLAAVYYLIYKATSRVYYKIVER